MIKMAIFDLDGTLVNSLDDLAISVNYALKRAGLEERPAQNYKFYVGNGRDMLIKRAMGEAADNKVLFEQVRDDYDAHYAVHSNDHTQAYPGCDKMLAELAAKGIMTSVLSNKPHQFVAAILDKLYPDHKFTVAWGQQPEYKCKPEPDALLAILNLYGVKPNECIYVGDSDVDVFTAKNANVRMVGVSWGFRGREELIGAGAPFVADSAEELLEYISELNEQD